MSQKVSFKANEFKEFVNGLNHFQKNHQLFPRLKISIDTFLQTLTPAKTTSSEKNAYAAFAKKYHVTLPLKDQSIEGVIAYTEIFRTTFPNVKAESQSYTFQTKNSRKYAFEVQWGLIGDFIQEHSRELEQKLIDLFAHGINFEKQVSQINA